MRAKKCLGQNFLIDKNVARKIVRILELSQNDFVLEIGPGKGALTREIIPYNCSLILLEKDLELVYLLKKTWPDLAVIVMDGLLFPWMRLKHLGQPKIVGNLPYNIGSPLIWSVVSQVRTAKKMVFTLQKEVAQRICAPPGNKVYGALSIWVQNFARVKREFDLKPTVFRPRPHVDSSVISIYPHQSKGYRSKEVDSLRELLHICFQNRRKTLTGILKSKKGLDIKTWLEKQGLDYKVRPEELSPQQFKDLSKMLID